MIDIIGAGPAGNYLAYLLAKDHEVNVHEEHSKIGYPIQCTGILTSHLHDLLRISKKFLVNTISKVKVYSANNEVSLKLREKNYVVHRTKFDSYIADMAKDEGTKYFLNSKFIGCELGKQINLKFNDGKQSKTDILVGADGPHSSVARSVGIYGKRRFYNGLQATIKKDFEKNLVEFYLGDRYIGWVVPENEEYARVGISAENDSAKHLNELFKRVGGKITARQAGAIPIYDENIKTQFENRIFLLGDAATQVKASTHGGIIPGMIAATELNKAIRTGKNYDKMWKARLGRDLKIHLMIKKMMDRFNEKDYDYLIKLVDNIKVKELIEIYDREFPSKFAFKLLLKEPRFLKFLFKM
ncbi:MAG TPA: NAD(P)/FAD-dependent oxidoreductase [Candidatus Nanoarchaeia archaeon]|nr:NAD(P)/FAD-dependent oxidoreductase [Candidatus Nanoarchaeia archaeon]